jgi:arginine kinase
MRASVHIRLPFLGQNMDDFKTKAEKLNLQIRGIHGEHSESLGGIFDISNKRRLGLTEKECVQDLHDGVVELIRMENDYATVS